MIEKNISLFLCKRRVDWYIQFIFIDVSEIIEQQLLSRKRVRSIISTLESWKDWLFIFDLRKKVYNLKVIKESLVGNNGSDEYSDDDVLNLVLNIQNIAHRVHSEVEKILALNKSVNEISKFYKDALEGYYLKPICEIINGQSKENIDELISSLVEQWLISEDTDTWHQIAQRETMIDKEVLFKHLFSWCTKLSDKLVWRILDVRDLLLEISDSLFIYVPEPSSVFVLNWECSKKYNWVWDFVLMLWWSIANIENLKRVLSLADKRLINSGMWIWETFYDIMARPIKKWYQCTFTKRDVIRMPDEATETHWLKNDLARFIWLWEAINDRASLLELFDEFELDTSLDDMDKKIWRLRAIELWKRIERESEDINYWIRRVSKIKNVYIVVWKCLSKMKFNVIPDIMKESIEELVANANYHWASNIQIKFYIRDNKLIVRIIDNWKWIERQALKEIRQNLVENNPNVSTRIWWNWYWLRWVWQSIKLIKWWSLEINSRQKFNGWESWTIVKLSFDIE